MCVCMYSRAHTSIHTHAFTYVDSIFQILVDNCSINQLRLVSGNYYWQDVITTLEAILTFRNYKMLLIFIAVNLPHLGTYFQIAKVSLLVNCFRQMHIKMLGFNETLIFGSADYTLS